VNIGHIHHYTKVTLKGYGWVFLGKKLKAKISVFFILNATHRANIFLHRTCIMLTKDFESQKYPYLRHLIFAKKVVCTYRLQKMQKGIV